MQAEKQAGYEASEQRTAGASGLHPLLAAIYNAAEFAGPDSVVATQAEGVVKLLCGLLHPSADKRLTTRSINRAEYPWLFATFAETMPVCPLAL